jgi:hypothetical protein
MKDYQASYSEKFKEALRKFNDSATALYFVVQTSTSHDYEDPFTTVTVYNKKKNTDWEAPLLSEFCSDPNKDLIATYQKVSLTTKLGKESINITVIKNVIGFGIATSLDQVNEIITYMEADNRDLRKIYFYDYDLVIQELVPAKASDLIAAKPNFSQPINGAWGAFPLQTDGDTDGDVKKKKGKKHADEHPTEGIIPGFNN